MLQLVSYQGQLVVFGPVPVSHDRPWLCQEMKEAREKFWRMSLDWVNCCFNDVAEMLMVGDRVSPQLMNTHGLTLDGQREFRMRLADY